MKKLYMLLAAVLLMVITGCGGGGGGGGSTPVSLSSTKVITGFSLNDCFGMIDEAGKTIAVTMPLGTDVTTLVATFYTTGASVKVGSTVQTSGSITSNFSTTSQVTYTVTAADATTQDYTVTVTVSSSSSGFLDTGFGATGTGGKITTAIGSSDDVAHALGIQSNGSIVVAGSSYNGSNYDFALVRYTKDGIIDTTFGTAGTGKVTTAIGSGDAAAYALVIQKSVDTILVAGYFYNSNDSNYYFALVKYTKDGIPDTTFGTGGIVTKLIGNTDAQAHALGVQSDGSIVVAGSSYDSTNSKYDFALLRYTKAGILDTGFGTAGIVTTSIGIGGNYDFAYALGIQSGDKILAAGFSNNGGNYDFALVIYTKDGIPDTTFGTGGIVTTPIGSSDDNAYALGIQSNGTSFKIVVAGSSYNGSNYDFALARYLP